MITRLTKKQESRLSEIAEEWIGYGLSTTTDRKKAESLIPLIYKTGGLKPPQKVIWCESPYAGYKKCQSLLKKNETVLPCYGNHEAHWLAFYYTFLEFGIKECEELKPLMEMAKCSGWFFPMNKTCILTPNPTHLSLDEEGRLHNLDRKAIEYPDDWGLYYVHGVNVDKKIVEEPHKITVNDIETQENIEARRVMIDRFGYNRSLPEGGDHGVGKYIEVSGAQEIHRDKWGILYYKEQSDDEPIVTVKVVNSTPEPDGSKKNYFLRVPSNIKTAHEAVAWTFGCTPKTYSPSVET